MIMVHSDIRNSLNTNTITQGVFTCWTLEYQKGAKVSFRQREISGLPQTLKLGAAARETFCIVHNQEPHPSISL